MSSKRYGASSSRNGAHCVAHRRWVAGEADEDEAEQDLHLDRLEAVRRAVKAGEAVARRHAEQAALVVVRPAVVRADDRARAVAAVVEQPRAAVPADVVEGADLPLAVPQHDDAVGAEVEGDEVARVRDRTHVAADLPARAQDALELEPVHLGVVVHPRRQRLETARRRRRISVNSRNAGHRHVPRGWSLYLHSIYLALGLLGKSLKTHAGGSCQPHFDIVFHTLTDI